MSILDDAIRLSRDRKRQASGGVNWDAVRAMEKAGYRANADGTITRPDGTIHMGASKKKKEKKPANSAAVSSINGLLRQYGLQDLSNYVDRWVRDGLTWPEIEAQLYDPKSAAGKIVDKVYPELRLRAEQGLEPINIAQVQQYRSTTRQLVDRLGFGDAITDVNALARDYIVNNKSLEELQGRLTEIGDYTDAVFNTNPVAKAKLDELEAYYGVRPDRGSLIAFALNDSFTEAELHKRLGAAAAGAAARTSGFGAIGREQAETLGALGVDEAAAREGFGQLAGLRGATGSLLGQDVDVVSDTDQIGAAFGGNEFARRRIARRQREQQGYFSGGGGFAQTRTGFGGVGTAD